MLARILLLHRHQTRLESPSTPFDGLFLEAGAGPHYPRYNIFVDVRVNPLLKDFIMKFFMITNESFILDDVMKTENWEKMKEENLAELFELQQMVFGTAETD